MLCEKILWILKAYIILRGLEKLKKSDPPKATKTRNYLTSFKFWEGGKIFGESTIHTIPILIKAPNYGHFGVRQMTVLCYFYVFFYEIVLLNCKVRNICAQDISFK